MAKRRRKTDRGERTDKVRWSRTREFDARLEEWAEEAAEAHDLELVDVDLNVHGRPIITIYVDRPEAAPGTGVEVGQCAKVSRYVEAYLDAEEGFPEKYVLEVSSPGIERELTKPKHYHQSVGKRVEVVVREQIDGKNKLVGELVSFEDDTFRLDREDGGTVDVALSNVARAKLSPEITF